MIMEMNKIEQQLLEAIAANDPFDYIYECISGNHGKELREYTVSLYTDVCIDHGFAPDDDFEEIINRILDDLGA